MPPEQSRVRRQLAAELAHLRTTTGLALRPFGDAAELAHARVRRIERLEVLPSVVEVRRWLDAAGARGATADRVLALAEAAHVETSPWADLLAASEGRHLQAIAAAREEAASMVCSYQQMIVPGLAQTSAYARALLPHLRVAIDPETDLPARMRRQEVLHEPGREFRFILTRRAFTWSPDRNLVSMDGQRDRLRELDRLPAVSVRILDDTAAPMGSYSSFTVYDSPTEPLVMIELEHHVTTLTESGDVDRYRERFVELWSAARSIQVAEPPIAD